MKSYQLSIAGMRIFAHIFWRSLLFSFFRGHDNLDGLQLNKWMFHMSLILYSGFKIEGERFAEN